MIFLSLLQCRLAIVSTVSSLSFLPSPTTFTRRCTWLSLSSCTNIHTSTALQSSVDGSVNMADATSATTLPFKYHHLTNVERIFCLSDLHTDHVDNLRWLRNHHNVTTLSSRDLLIVAGDISHQLSTFHDTMSILRNQYQCQVLFVPGNHEAWLSSSSSTDDDSTIVTSFDKLQQIYDLCRTMGVYVDPVYICRRYDDEDEDEDASSNNHKSGHPVWILPLQSWYDGSLTFDETLCAGFDKWPWMDFIKCHWDPQRFPPSTLPPNSRIPQGLVEFFLQLNQDNIILPFQQLVREQPNLLAPCITVSHFAPNQQCLPDWKDLSETRFQVDAWLDHGAATMSAKFAKVAGTKLLDDQIRSTLGPLPKNETNANDRSHISQHQRPLIHIFGHSHRPKDFIFNEIRYIHNPLGKPRERQLHMISPNVTFQYIWDHRMGEIPGPTVVRYWEQYGGGKEMLWQRMSSSKLQNSNNITSTTSTTAVADIQGGRYRQQP